MATYKKRGYKPKTKVEKEVEEHDESTTAEVFDTLDEGASRTEAWVEGNWKYLLIFIGIVIIGVLGYLGYKKFIQEPKNIEASNEMYQAQNYFNEAIAGAAQKDSLFNLALNGGEGKYGFLDIIDSYGGTQSANLAHYYAGMAYLNMNQYKQAIDQLEDFESDDEMLGPLAKGGIGDAFAQLDQLDEALDYYAAAAKMQDNDFTAPRFLFKASMVAIELGQKDKAAGFLKEIKEKYPKSTEAGEAELYLGMVSQ
ncbi:MAG: hypothetical protein CL868_20265 [Cytophagaceae bacterium]|nr:hypothetical protein [Cytophagaceae bacterium]|tara:strand:- start:2573 stop:3334 length:762 start_codon:yes stop_codon:yes gene_type:complete